MKVVRSWNPAGKSGSARWRRGLAVLAWAGMALAAGPSSAATQQLALSAGWNLIAINIDPIDPRPEVLLAQLGNNLRSIWAYDAATQTWATYPPISGEASLTVLRPGVGYWLNVAANASLSVAGADGVSSAAAPDLQPGWNLIGFTTAEPKGYERALQGIAFDQLWTFLGAGGFKGVVFVEDGGQRTAMREDSEILNVEPGRGYWVWVAGTSPISLQPELGTTLPPDVDVEPFVCGVIPCEQRAPFAQVSPGDRDLGGDGVFDVPGTQRAVDFGDFSSSQILGISNRGVGLLSWHAAIDDPDHASWLSFRVTGQTASDDQFLTEMSGSVATDSAALELFVERRGLGPGRYRATISVESNGRADAEPRRVIAVSMEVPPLDGDYRVETTIATVNGQPAELYNPRLFLTVYRDADGLKGILDGSRTLLIPEHCAGGSDTGTACSEDSECQVRCEKYVRLAGRIYQNGTNRFILNGSFELPQGAEDNPYQADLRRDVTLIGNRPQAGDMSLGPQDLSGQYFETIRNVLGDPIRLEGTFRATRLNALPTSRDEGTQIQRSGPTLPKDVPEGGSCLTPKPEIKVEDNLLLSEVDVHVNASHPQQLDIELETPTHKTLILRRDNPATAEDVIYDQTQEPVDSLAALVGDLSAGIWRLCVRDTIAGTASTLRSWDLILKGTRVHDIHGAVQGAGAGVRVLLSGCGHSELAITDGQGRYAFTNLVDCPYQLTVHAPGLEVTSTEVVLQGGDADVALAPQSRSPILAPTPGLPKGARCRIVRASGPCDTLSGADVACGFTSLTTSGGAGTYYRGCEMKQQPGCLPLVPIQAGRLQYALDSANFDIDRPPYATCQGAPGNEDSDCFLGDGSESNAKNCAGPNGKIDGPVNLGRCPSSNPVRPCAVHAYVAIGMPVIGPPSVSGNLTMSIGASP